MPMSAPMLRPLGRAGGGGGGGGGGDYEQRRGSARQRGYTSAWDQASTVHRMANPLCVGCQAVGRVVACDVVDHTKPHKGDPRLFWDPDNWQSSCSWHHDTVKQRLEQRWQAGELTDADLRLDSQAAVALTLQLDPG